MTAMPVRDVRTTPKTIFGVSADAPVLVQGATGRTGRRHMALMRAAGTNIAAGVSPSRSGQTMDAVPIFGTCADAVAATGAAISVVMVPPLSVLSAITEAADAGIRLIVSIAEGVPVADCARAMALTRERGIRWVGSSTPGLAIPGVIKLGFLPDLTLRPGKLGIMSKSGTLSYEVAYRLSQKGFGQSRWIGVGGDPLKGTRFADLLPEFADDPATKAVVVVGEIGGNEEEELAEAILRERFDKPVFAIIAGQGAREGISMGHAGAMIAGGTGTVAAKAAALGEAGAHVSLSIRDLTEAVASSPLLQPEAGKTCN